MQVQRLISLAVLVIVVSIATSAYYTFGGEYSDHDVLGEKVEHVKRHVKVVKPRAPVPSKQTRPGTHRYHHGDQAALRQSHQTSTQSHHHQPAAGEEDDDEREHEVGSHHAKPTLEEAIARGKKENNVPLEKLLDGLNVTHKSPHSREYRISTDLPYPPFEEPTDLMLDVRKPEFESTYQTLHEVHFWAAGWITNDRSEILIKPSKTKRSRLMLEILPEPTPLTMGVDTLGKYKYALIWCDHWSTTYIVFVVDCLPRLAVVYPELLKRHRDADNPLYVVAPGEFWAMQFLVEVLGIRRDHLLPMPSHIVWEIYYPNLYASFETLYYAKPIPENVPYGLVELRSMVLERVPLPKPAVASPAGGPRVLHTERSDITNPYNLTGLLGHLQLLEPTALFQTVRFESRPVIQQLRLVGRTDVLFGPTGGNLVNLLFLPPHAKVVELLSNNWTKHRKPTDVERLCQIVGLKYERLQPARDWEQKLQPVYTHNRVLQAIMGGLDLPQPRRPSQLEPMHLSTGPPFIGCQHLFHLPRRRKFIGWFKYGFLIPDLYNGFVFKFPRQAFWKRVLKEMVILRNLTGDHIAPAKALCFYEMSMAQTLIGGALRRQNVTHRTMDTFVAALSGFHRLWAAHQDWGRFFFYCDAGPKNWAMGKDGKLKMFDFDASYWVVDGVLCAKDRHCGCMQKSKHTDPENRRESACVNNRCTYEGMESKMQVLANAWIFSTFKGLTPQALEGDEATENLWGTSRHKKLQRNDIVTYLQDLKERYGDKYEIDYCGANLDTPECDAVRQGHSAG
uniref:Glycosyltransferase 61 catalytic domain-containing protein n=1 Tax=Eutreptiella gymnastica TaxID=73025 RepID=A0A7S1HVL4_9EUGL|mmetsp:Transcript_10823/g.19276  ORF Transcript_10823/g.19276 Transcript_10823/m.19276 type:complete len:790 (+) Transcript_10823:37-2406(+)